MDELSKPLGQRPRRAPRIPVQTALPYAVTAVLAVSLGTFVGWALLADDPLGGEPVAVVAAFKAETGRAPAAPGARRYDGPPNAPTVADQAPASVPGASAGGTTVNIIDGSTGQRRAVVVPGPASSAVSAKEKRAAGDAQLIETTRHGRLPRIAPDGTRPIEAYAQQVTPLPGKPDVPRVAIVVAGLGIGTTRTAEAIDKLPPAVTLAFVPYGGDLEGQVAQARARSHEVLLQVPMEPPDYPNNDAGPQTLLTSLDPGLNMDRLHWAMARFQGYVGITNYMGGRFAGSEHALAPVLRETAKRGLIYFDDGTAPRSLAPQLAGAIKMPFAKSDLSIDMPATAVDIDRALGRLEAIARQRGVAIGVASALPVSIERIVRWAKGAEARGIQLVPISAAAVRAAKSS